MFNDGIDRSSRRKQTGEDFTPTKLVFEILRKLPKEAWLDQEKTWFDPACGNGQFLYAIMRVLRWSLRKQISNQEERQQHIVTKMIYGVDLMKDNVLVTCKRLGVPHNPVQKRYVSATIICANTLKHGTPKQIGKLFSNARGRWNSKTYTVNFA